MKKSFNEVIDQDIQLEIAVYDENEEEIYLDKINFELRDILTYVHHGRIEARELLQQLEIPILEELSDVNFKELLIYLKLYDSEGNSLGIETEYNWTSNYKQFISNSFDEFFEEIVNELVYEKYGNRFSDDIERL